MTQCWLRAAKATLPTGELRRLLLSLTWTDCFAESDCLSVCLQWYSWVYFSTPLTACMLRHNTASSAALGCCAAALLLPFLFAGCQLLVATRI